MRSNIERADYAGSHACSSCHAAIYRSFIQSPMHNMTRLPQDATIHAPFDGHVFRFKNDQVVLDEHDGQRWMRIVSPEFGNHLFRVTKVIGGHHREDFAGVDVEKADPHTEWVLPVSYLLNTGRFRYKGYSVMIHERPGIKPGAVWNKTCIFCHNTEPYLSTILGELTGPGLRPYQGVTVDRTLPPEKRAPFDVIDSSGLCKALDAEIRYLGEAPAPHGSSVAEHIQQARNATYARFNETNLIEVGIGCESCHGGSREHAKNPWRAVPSLEPRSPYLRVATSSLPDAARRSQDITRVCARCHQVLFSRYPWTWEGKRRNDPAPGGASINSGEARDLLLSNCLVTCTDCHDPHAHDDRAHLQELEGVAGNTVCLKCHTQLGTPGALRAHAHHAPDGPGGLCLNCHMPRKNMSLDARLTRYHRIGSPTDPARVEGDRPLECALCHADKSVGALVDSMERWWPHHYDRAALKNLYGDLDANAIEATLLRGKAHEQAVALYLIGQRHERQLASQVAGQLANPYPLVRCYADNALATTGFSSGAPAGESLSAGPLLCR